MYKRSPYEVIDPLCYLLYLCHGHGGTLYSHTKLQLMSKIVYYHES